eukprot:gene20721-27533_t
MNPASSLIRMGLSSWVPLVSSSGILARAGAQALVASPLPSPSFSFTPSPSFSSFSFPSPPLAPSDTSTRSDNDAPPMTCPSSMNSASPVRQDDTNSSTAMLPSHATGSTTLLPPHATGSTTLLPPHATGSTTLLPLSLLPFLSMRPQPAATPTGILLAGVMGPLGGPRPDGMLASGGLGPLGGPRPSCILASGGLGPLGGPRPRGPCPTPELRGHVRGFFNFRGGTPNLPSLQSLDPRDKMSNIVIATNIFTFLVCSVDPRWVSRFAQVRLTDVSTFLGCNVDPRLVTGFAQVSKISKEFSSPLGTKLSQVNYMVSDGQWYRLLTASLIHGNIISLGLSMLGVHWLGKPLERQVGHNTFLAIYAVSSLGGGLAEYMLGPPYLVCMGSAASVAGLLSSYIAYKVVNRAFVGFGSEDLSWIGQLAAINIGMSLLVGGQIISMSHLGGLAGGAVAMMLFGPRYVRESGSVINRPILPWFR